jgi:hypothetical protein
MQKQTKIVLGVAIAIITLIIVAVVLSFRQAIETSSSEYAGGGVMGMIAPAPAMDMAVSQRNSLAVEESVSYTKTAPDSTDNDLSQSTERLVIKTGRFSIVVADVPTAVKSVNEYAVQKNGYVVSSETSKAGLAPYATVIIRVPATIFDEGVGDIKALGDVQSELINGQDITEEYVDLEARLKNLRATESQYLEIMKKAYKIEDILQVQNYLSNVRAEIESMMGRMKYLKDSADMSTITVNLSTDPEALPVVDDTDKWKPWNAVKESARGLLGLAKSLSYVVIWFAVYIPLWIAIALVGWIGYRVVKKRMNRKINM